MRKSKGRQLSDSKDGLQCKMNRNGLELPTGQTVSTPQILVGITLLEIQFELELRTTSKIAKYAKAIAKFVK